jgi:hypothetical protein
MKRINAHANHRRRTWMPVIDRGIGTVDTRLWQRDAGYDFDWQSTDPWTRRIVYYTEAK